MDIELTLQSLAESQSKMAAHLVALAQSQKHLFDSQQRVVDTQQRIVDSQERILDSHQLILDSHRRIVETAQPLIESQERFLESQQWMVDAFQQLMKSQRRLPRHIWPWKPTSPASSTPRKPPSGNSKPSSITWRRAAAATPAVRSTARKAPNDAARATRTPPRTPSVQASQPRSRGPSSKPGIPVRQPSGADNP